MNNNEVEISYKILCGVRLLTSEIQCIGLNNVGTNWAIKTIRAHIAALEAQLRDHECDDDEREMNEQLIEELTAKNTALESELASVKAFVKPGQGKTAIEAICKQLAHVDELEAREKRLREAIENHRNCFWNCPVCGHAETCADDDICLAIPPLAQTGGELVDELGAFNRQFLASQKPLDPEFARVLNEHTKEFYVSATAKQTDGGEHE